MAKTAAPPDEPSSACPLSNLLVATAGGSGVGGDNSTALPAGAPTPATLAPPKSEPDTKSGGGGGGAGGGGERGEVLRLWRKPTEDLSLEEMEW